MKELIHKRFEEVTEPGRSFEESWLGLFDAHVGGEDSFRYILSRTLFRPRDLLNFVRKCIHVAISRGHARVEEEDIKLAEKER